ncbi:MAG: hypothetical protein H7A40_04160 [Chlamydiales bacterium]|nr:hypothetical protein [Chlamydiales bacterium]
MNVLPFVIVIIALFAGLNATFFSHSRTLMLTEQCYENYMDAERTARDAGINDIYKKMKSTKPGKKNTELKPVTPVKALRHQSHYVANARINVFGWLFADQPDSTLQQHVLELCSRIYGKIPEYQKMAEQGKLKAFFEEIAAGAKSSKATTFDSIRLKNDSSLFYKMCRGTNYFDIENNSGYPPLDYLFRIDEASAKTPIRWRIASPRILIQFLGNNLANKLLKAESDLNLQGKQFDKKELDELVGQDAFIGAEFEAVQSQLDHSCGKLQSKLITVSDPSSCTKVEKQYISIPENS